MKFTRELVILAATALAWFAYAVTINDAGGFSPLIIEIARNTALVLSGIAVVRLLRIVLVDLLVERVWGIPSTALMRIVVDLVLGTTAAALILKYGNGFNITALLTTSALLTAILGLAAQSTIAALFSGIALQLERHINPGDIIRIDNRPARVEVVGWRSMTVRRADGTLVIVPNTTVAANPTPLFRPGAVLRSEAMISGPMSVPPSAVMDIIRSAVTGIQDISRDHPVTVDFFATQTHDGYIDYRVRCFGRSTMVEDDPLAPLIRLRVWYAYQRHGIVVPRWPLVPGHAGVLPATTLADATEPQVASLAAALAGTGRWRDAQPADLERLVRAGRRLLYAPHEPILLPRDLDQYVATVVSGDVRLSGALPSAGIEPPPGAVRGDHAAAADWDQEGLLEIEAQLGRAIGPYARLAVRQAARESSDLATLYGHLANLIRDRAARQEFAAHAPRSPARAFGRGTVFTVRCDGRSLAAPPGTLTARGEVELLALPPREAGEIRQGQLTSG